MTLDDAPVTRSIFHPRGEDYGYVPQGMLTETQSKAPRCVATPKCIPKMKFQGDD